MPNWKAVETWCYCKNKSTTGVGKIQIFALKKQMASNLKKALKKIEDTNSFANATLLH